MRPARRPWRRLLIGLLCIAALATARAQNVREPAPGVLLVAADNMGDPRFDQAVVLLIKHDGSGSWGLVVNKPTEIGVSELLPDLEAAGSSPVYFGGPVQLDHVSFLYRGQVENGAGGTGVAGIQWSDSEALLKRRLADEPGSVRVYAGYTGWAPGQLEFEIANGGWRLIEGRADNVFSDDPGKLWDRLTNALGGIAI